MTGERSLWYSFSRKKANKQRKLVLWPVLNIYYGYMALITTGSPVWGY